MRVLLAILLFACLAWADQFRLYLTDGSFHVVREYEKLADRVRYYSVERADWEELPLDLVDFKKTEAERGARVADDKRRAALADAEEKYERAEAREVSSIPQDAGVYAVRDAKVVDLKRVELKTRTDKKRSALRIIVAAPIISGKASLDIAGASAATELAGEKPILYFRIDSPSRFTIVRLKATKTGRTLGNMKVEPIAKLTTFEFDMVDVFRQQLRDDLYRVWPTQALTPGEYALVQYSEGMESELLAWDFRVVAEPPKKP
jgi:hypothetical protein